MRKFDDVPEGEGLPAAITSLRAAARRMRAALNRGRSTKDAARLLMQVIDAMQNNLPAEEELEP